MSDNLNPNYYKLPNGAETIDISQYLSGCGSQAVQYIVRSTRIDKDLKGNPIEDLRKAVWFIETEIDRLEADQESWEDAGADAPWEDVGTDAPEDDFIINHITHSDPVTIHFDGTDIDPDTLRLIFGTDLAARL